MRRYFGGWLLGLLALPALAASPVEIQEAGLLVNRQGQAELGITLVNRLGRELWVRVHFITPIPEDSCLVTKELAAEASEFYVCPQPDLLAGLDYRVEIRVYGDLAQLRLLDTFSTSMRFEPAEVDYIRSLP